MACPWQFLSRHLDLRVHFNARKRRPLVEELAVGDLDYITRSRD
jgi:hypothetical protein